MKKEHFDLSKGYPTREEQLAALAKMQDQDIDFSDITEITDFSKFRPVREVLADLYRPIKKSATIRFDADILAWFKARSPKYQTAINAALREYIAMKEKR